MLKYAKMQPKSKHLPEYHLNLPEIKLLKGHLLSKFAQKVGQVALQSWEVSRCPWDAQGPYGRMCAMNDLKSGENALRFPNFNGLFCSFQLQIL